MSKTSMSRVAEMSIEVSMLTSYLLTPLCNSKGDGLVEPALSAGRCKAVSWLLSLISKLNKPTTYQVRKLFLNFYFPV